MDRKEYQKKQKQQRKLTHKRVELQFLKNEYKTFERIAQKEKISTNKLIANMALAYRDTRYFVPTEIKESLDRVGWLIRNIADNINQIAHRANCFQDIDCNQVFAHLADLDREIKDYVRGQLV